MNDTQIQTAYGAGRWFPGNPDILRKTVREYIDAAETPKVPGQLVAALAPHAGYQYSGPVAGYTFKAIQAAAADGNKPDTVLILGFSHRHSFPGIALLPGSAIETPLGQARFDRELISVLNDASERIFTDAQPHRGEHSAENMIPFIQTALPDVPVVMAIMGDHDPRSIDALLTALKQAEKTHRVMVLASTDLLHDPDYEKVTGTDKNTLELISHLQTKELLQEWKPSHQVCCGIAPVLCAMLWAQHNQCKEGVVLHYRNSGDDFPESRGEWVVGYGAVVFY